MVHATQVLAYSKDYVYYILLIYNMILLFQNLLYSSMICYCVIMTCDRYVTVMLTSNPKFKIKK